MMGSGRHCCAAVGCMCTLPRTVVCTPLDTSAASLKVTLWEIKIKWTVFSTKELNKTLVLKKNCKETAWQKFKFLQGQQFLKPRYVLKVAQNYILPIRCVALNWPITDDVRLSADHSE